MSVYQTQDPITFSDFFEIVKVGRWWVLLPDVTIYYISQTKGRFLLFLPYFSNCFSPPIVILYVVGRTLKVNYDAKFRHGVEEVIVHAKINTIFLSAPFQIFRFLAVVK